MNETSPELAELINQELDNVLPFEPFIPESLDLALASELMLAAKVRMDHTYEVFDQEKVSGTIARMLKAKAIYQEFYPNASDQEDMRLDVYDRDRERIYLSMLSEFGTESTRADFEVQFRGKYGTTARTALDFCRESRMTQSNGRKYLRAAYDFTNKLFEIDHIETDELLRTPLILLGKSLSEGLNLGNEVFVEWVLFLREKIMNIDLIGEDGEVMEDMTEGLLSWVNDWFAIKSGIKTQPETSSVE